MRKFLTAAVVVFVFVLSGCAADQRCVIATGRDDAIVTEHGHRVGAGRLANLNLDAGRDHRVLVSSDGFEPEEVTFASHVSIAWERLLVPLILCPPVILAVPVLALAGFYDRLDPVAAAVTLEPQGPEPRGAHGYVNEFQRGSPRARARALAAESESDDPGPK